MARQNSSCSAAGRKDQAGDLRCCSGPLGDPDGGMGSLFGMAAVAAVSFVSLGSRPPHLAWPDKAGGSTRVVARPSVMLAVQFHERAFCGLASVRSSSRRGAPSLVVMRVRAPILRSGPPIVDTAGATAGPRNRRVQLKRERMIASNERAPILLENSVDNAIEALRYHPEDQAGQESCRGDPLELMGTLCLILRLLRVAF
jgi:hypothetical protein